MALVVSMCVLDVGRCICVAAGELPRRSAIVGRLLLLLRKLPVRELSALAVVGGNLCVVLVVALVAVASAAIV